MSEQETRPSPELNIVRGWSTFEETKKAFNAYVAALRVPLA